MRQTDRPARVLIVEDSAVVRVLLTHIVSQDPRLAVAGAVASAEEAIDALPALRPDVISMDIQLPGMDGLEATRRIMADRPTPIVVVSASVDAGATGSSMNALRAGALSVVEKPVGLTHAGFGPVAREIATQLSIMSQVAVVRRRMTTAAVRPARPARAKQPRALLCAASTGGPQALAKLFAALPACLPVPVLLVQHMGASFMAGFAGWLDTVVPQPVEIARAGQVPRPGVIHCAPGDVHLGLDADGRMTVSATPPVGGQRPAATHLFMTAAEALGGEALAVVLTGMGEDGAPGVRRLIELGGSAVAEDASSAVVYGMPAAAVRAGATALPLDLIAPQVRRLLERVPA